MMAKEFYQRRGIVNWVCRAMESIPVARSGQDMASIREALTRLESGQLLGVFPEGRLNIESPDERLLPGGSGVAWLAIKSKAPVIPVFIHNAPRGKSVVDSFFVRAHATLVYGSPIDLSAWHQEKTGHKELAEVTDTIMDALAKLGGIRFYAGSRKFVVFCHSLISGWPGLEGVSPKPRGLLHFVQSSPRAFMAVSSHRGHPILTLSIDAALT